MCVACSICLQVTRTLLGTPINGHTYADLVKMGLLYIDASNCVMVPPVLWKGVLGEHMHPVFDLRDLFGRWHDGRQTGELLEHQGALAVTARANIPFAEWVAKEEHKDAVLDPQVSGWRTELQAKAHVRGTLLCASLPSASVCVTTTLVAACAPGQEVHSAPEDAAAARHHAAPAGPSAGWCYHAHHARGRDGGAACQRTVRLGQGRLACLQ